MQERVLRFLGQVLPFGVERELVVLAQRLQIQPDEESSWEKAQIRPSTTIQAPSKEAEDHSIVYQVLDI